MKIPFKLKVFRRFTNEQFQRLFWKNTGIVFLGIVIPLLVAVLSVYFFSHSSLLAETDAANLRSLENTKATIDMICTETESILMRYASNQDVATLLTVKKSLFPQYNYIATANDIIRSMNASRRSYLDSAITIYSEENNYTLSTMLGGQIYSSYGDKALVDQYLRLKSAYPDEKSFCYVWKTAYFLNVDNPRWILTFYRTIPVTGLSKNNFVAVDVDLSMFASYLTSNTSPDAGTILIVDEEQNVLFDSTGERIGSSAQTVFAGEDELSEFISGAQGSATIELDGTMQRASWIKASWGGWKYVQLVPFDDYIAGMTRLQSFLYVVMSAGLVIALLIAYAVTVRLFRPIGDILKIIESPNAYDQQSDRGGEVKYVLVKVLESFQRNIILEEEMLTKVASLRSARAKALQEQMTPHFLHNALQAINWLAFAETGNENSRTGRSIITLSEIMRSCMEQSDNFTTVGGEIDYVRKFMSIEQLRFGNEVVCRFDVDPALENERLLRISLQPLVENAITHGIQPNGGRGSIYVLIRYAQEKMLYICVEDDGVGMSDEQLAATEEALRTEYVYANQHLGLFNLSQRIKLVYGEEYQIRVGRSEYGGVKVYFTIPCVESV